MLYFLPTPIGNLGDISARCLDILEAGEIIICEDTRVGKSLLNLLNISLKNKEFYCLNSHNFDTFIANFDDNLNSFDGQVKLVCCRIDGWIKLKKAAVMHFLKNVKG